MKLYLQGHDYQYAVEQIMLILLPEERPEYPDGPPGPEDSAAWSTLSRTGAKAVSTTKLQWQGRTATAEAFVQLPPDGDKLTLDRLLQRVLKQSFYKAAVELLGEAPPWGALTGIRPAKLASRAMEAGATEEETRALFRDVYFVSPSRTELALAAAKAGMEAKASLRPEELSLYVGIPFCPTRCAYCSFVSADVKRSLKLVPPFLDALDREIDAVAELLPRAGAAVRTLYFGGGTPTTLTADQLDRLMGRLEQGLDLSRLTEYTVEAGRPDTITADKMAVIAAHGGQRVSVNPQSMRDEVLQAMGRSHTAADILTAYQIVRDAGIPAVNMDLIAGLPRDDVPGFRYTLDAVLDLAPENITVHTLALKKGARLMMERQGLPDGAAVSAMLDYAWSRLAAAGYRPYYLYRQKYMSGALENIGWCKPGFEGLYNICIMEELHTILALGGGGSTKLTDPSTGKVVRMANPKYPYEYINGIERVISAKEALVEFHQRVIGKETGQTEKGV